MKNFCVAFLFLLMLLPTRSWSGDDGKLDLSSAETIAADYMTAFFRGDIKTAVGLMHPDVLEFNKNRLRQAYMQAKEAGKEQDFRKDFKFIEDFDALLDLPAPELWLRLIEGNRSTAKRSSLDAMATAVVTVVRSERVGEDGAKVILRILTPSPTGKLEQDGALLLSLHNNRWRVVRDEKMK